VIVGDDVDVDGRRGKDLFQSLKEHLKNVVLHVCPRV